MTDVTINGFDLTLEDVERVAQGRASAVLDDAARERMAASRQVVQELVHSGEVVYGVTTGFGSLASQRIDASDAATLQENLLVSHAVGIGPNHGRHVTRAMLLLRANALARGNSGCRPEIVDRLLDFLRVGIHPLVPEQ